MTGPYNCILGNIAGRKRVLRRNGRRSAGRCPQHFRRRSRVLGRRRVSRPPIRVIKHQSRRTDGGCISTARWLHCGCVLNRVHVVDDLSNPKQSRRCRSGAWIRIQPRPSRKMPAAGGPGPSDNCIGPWYGRITLGACTRTAFLVLPQ